MKKLLFTFILLGLATFGFGQTTDLEIQNYSATPIQVEIWAVTTPTCTPGCLIATVFIPAYSNYTHPAPGAPCDTWGRVVLLSGASGAIGNPGTCAATNTLTGIYGGWTGCGTCTQVVKFW